MLKYIFHLSDIHIRNGDNINSRYEEYNTVINNTIISINEQINIMKLNIDDFIIIISGDIFHNRYNASNFGLLLFNNLIKSLTKIGKLIIFEGNHERLIDNNPSLITSLNFDINNLIVLNESQTLIIDNIGFSYLSLFDTMNDYKLTGRKDILPSFPKIIEDVKYKIALFHGTFISCKLFNGDIIKDDDNSSYPLEMIKDFDYAILGDIHKRQIFNYKNKVIGGYPSSLIQQNFGEDLIEHGYLIWDLYNKKIKEVNVYNDIGYINIKENANGEILIRKNGKYECLLEEEINNNIIYFPKKLEIKIFSKINFNNLNIILKRYNIVFNIFSRIDERNLLSLDISNNNEDLNDEITINNIYNIDNNYLLTYFKKLLTDYKYDKLIEIIKNKDLLLFDKNKYPEDLFNEIIKRNKELSLVIQSCIKNDDAKQIKQSFLIKYLEWEGLLCYENKNWLNMHDLNSKSFMVKGKNGTGKSAIYDILLLSLWGENTKSSSFSGGIINHNKNNAYTIIDIELDGILYRIKRDYTKREDKTKVHLKYSYLYKFQNDKDLELLKKNNDCNTEIKKLFGTIDDFLNSSMITQNNDNDILKLDAKKTLEIIDKSYNVDYIYNLYNLFKTAINKYRDFKRIVESKKEVYEKLVSNNKIDEITDNEIIKLNDTLKLKLEENEELIKKYNEYDNIDIKNPKTLIILETDYLSLIKSLDLNKLLCDDDYNKYKERYNELKYILKDEKDLLKLKNCYTEDIKNKINGIIVKPCDLSILEREEKQLKNYLEQDNKFKTNENIEELENKITILNDEYKTLELYEKELISNKPIKIEKPKINKDIILSEIKLLYTNDNFKDFVLSLNIKQSSNNTIIINNNSLTYDEYSKLLDDVKTLEEIIKKSKDKLLLLENDFNLTFTKQQNKTIINKPLDEFKQVKYKTSITINKELKTIDINSILQKIEHDDNIINSYNIIIEKINIINNELDDYKKELLLLTSNEDYKYNPECIYCCKRPWVCRIKELDILIKKLETDKETSTLLININDYNEINERNIKNKELKNRYYLLTEWFNYYKSKEEYELITKKLNKIISDKTDLNNIIIINETKLKDFNNIINTYKNRCYELYETLIKIEQYEDYKLWDDKYNDVIKKKYELKNNINYYTEIINYYNNIKPRIDKYLELKHNYNKWIEYDNIIKIINTNELFKINELLDIYDKYNEYNINNTKKPFIKLKLDLNDKIKIKEKEIKDLNDRLIKQSTINGYNKDNRDNYDRLYNIIIDLDNTIDILETIIINFQAFRIEMYDKYILNKLTDRANKIIKTLCHTETKPFKLDYIITVIKDIIHINWLINNDYNNGLDRKVSENTKQIISINQASGYQQFVISMALRMSLFMNKYEIRCNQLFIDEGFINFDKYNLSIVPSFLKSLLSYFNNIIIVSHIDLIQDNIDEKIDIKYNKLTSISNIEYNDYKKTIIKRNKNKQID